MRMNSETFGVLVSEWNTDYEAYKAGADMVDKSKETQSLEYEIEFLKKQIKFFQNQLLARKAELQDLRITNGEKLDSLELDIRTYNSLKRSGINTVEDLMAFFSHPHDALGLFHLRNFGQISMRYTVEALIKKGFLPSDYPVPNKEDTPNYATS